MGCSNNPRPIIESFDDNMSFGPNKKRINETLEPINDDCGPFGSNIESSNKTFESIDKECALLGPIRERFDEPLEIKEILEFKEIVNFSDVKKGDIYVNLIHFDKNMKKNENFEYYRYFSIKLIGEYRPFENINMLKLFLSKTKQIPEPPSYILMISGSESIDILNEFHDFSFITDIIIFCFEINKYIHLKEKYTKIKLISNNIYEIRKFLLTKRFSKRDLNMDNHLFTTPLITYFDYKKGLFPVHRILSYFFDERFETFSNNYYEISQNFIYYSTFEIEVKKKILAIMEDLMIYDSDNFPEKCIEYYTGEDLCYVFNRALRNFEKFYVEMAHFIGPFYYGIYRYSLKHPEKQLKNYQKTLFRDLTMSRLDLYSYQFCENDIICFPSFTSTTYDERLSFKPTENANRINYEDIEEKSFVKMIITYNPQGECEPQGVDISDKAQFDEKEILLFPFTFLNIDKVEIHSGKKDDEHLIYMTIINKGDVLEYGLKNKKAFKLTEHGTKISIDRENNSSCNDNELYYGMSFKYIKDDLF